MTQQKKITPRSIDFGEDHTKRLLRAFPSGLVVFDLETTGLSSLCDKIIEIGAIKIAPSGEIFEFATLINPEIEIPEKSTAIHGITDEMVADSPKIEVSIKSFYEFIEDYPLVAHNAQFDIGFIIFQFHLYEIKPRPNQVFCSCQYARRTLKKSPNHKLSTLCKHLGITLTNHHRAVDDAMATTELVSHSIKHDSELELIKRAKIYQLDEFHESTEQSEIHQKIIDITKSESAAKMIYNGGSMKNVWRPIMPVGLLPTPRGDVLYAHCLVSDLYKSFLIKKITEIESCLENELERLKSELE
jgi:DNA polymerase-3 subunit epsilon